MLAKRIIPCLDVDNGRVQKGVNFKNLRDVGDPSAIAAEYEKQGADELVFLDITATNEKRKPIIEVTRQVAKQVFIPFTVGGGINSVTEMKQILKTGADKIAINTAAVEHPDLITAGAKKFGRQCIVLAMDVKWDPQTKSYRVYTHGGKHATNLDAMQWAKKDTALGAGELLVTSMDRDGTENGYDVDLYQKLNQVVNVPVIASGGCGKLNDFYDVFQNGQVDGALAASVLHFGQLKIKQIKADLKKKGVVVR